MFSKIIVPVDGSEEYPHALKPAQAFAKALGAELEVASFHSAQSDGIELERVIRRQATDAGVHAKAAIVKPLVGTIADQIAQRLSGSGTSIVVMSTRGRGRTAALLGSVATEIVETTSRPTVLVGPECKVDDFKLDGPLVIAADNDDGTKQTLSVVARLVDRLHLDPVLVNVLDPTTLAILENARAGPRGDDIPAETAVAHRLALKLGESTGRVADFATLHSAHTGRAIADFAENRDASTIVMSTHARSAVPRLLLGSVTADVLRHATCPVLALPLPST